MKYIKYVNEDGWVSCPKYPDAPIAVEVSEEQGETLSCFPNNKSWRYNFETKEFYLDYFTDTESLQEMRQNECFNIIDNRSKLWYDNLTQEQYKELQDWYKAWLNVTETKIIPEKPEWLK